MGTATTTVRAYALSAGDRITVSRLGAPTRVRVTGVRVDTDVIVRWIAADGLTGSTRVALAADFALVAA